MTLSLVVIIERKLLYYSCPIMMKRPFCYSLYYSYMYCTVQYILPQATTYITKWQKERAIIRSKVVRMYHITYCCIHYCSTKNMLFTYLWPLA